MVREGAAADATLVAAALAGDGGAFATLFDIWFDRCFDVAFRILRNRDLAAEAAQDVFLNAWRDLSALRDHAAFGGWVLRAARNQALNRLEKERRTVALGDATITAVDEAAAAPDAAVGALSGSGAELIWAASAALGERDASILDLHLRHGLAAPELADALGVTPNNAHQLLFRLRAKLGDAIRSFVLWHHDRPACPELQDALHQVGLRSFGPEAAKVAQRHAAACARCAERQRSALATEALFAGVPLVLAGPELRAKVIASLRAEGVPVGGAQSEVAATDSPSPDGPPAAPEAEDTRSGRRGLVVAAVLAALLLAGGAVLAQQRNEPPTALGVATPASPDSSPSTTAGPAGSAPATAPPSTVAPPPPPTTVAPPPTTVVPSPTTTSTTSPRSTTSTVALPAVRAFTLTATPPAPPCETFERRMLLSWSTTGATSVKLTGPKAPTTVQRPSGTAVACLPPGTPPVAASEYSLTATGPGGTATSTAT